MGTEISHAFEQRIEGRPWFESGLAIDGEAAQEYLDILRSSHNDKPRSYCIYVHVPFCSSICSYCALYTRAVRGDKDRVFDEYLTRVQKSISTHPNAQGSLGPITVHYGGGTPLHIGMERFRKLAHSLRKSFGNPSECEWALETTTSSIDLETIEQLADLNFKRIHLGIQTLDNQYRKRFRRRESGKSAIEKIQLLHEHDFFCSVDLILGFENATESLLEEDLSRLFEAGVRMFSICELRQRSGKKLTTRDHQEQSQRNYNLWKTVWHFMEDHKLIPIHLGQFAQSHENNLYYTHPARGEDCVAIGPYAHGSAGRLYYANKLLPDYYKAIESGTSPIGIAVLYDDRIQIIRDLERELLAHRILKKTLEKVMSVYTESFEKKLKFWLSHELLIQSQDKLSLTLSREGSWFIGNMIKQIRQLAEEL